MKEQKDAKESFHFGFDTWITDTESKFYSVQDSQKILNRVEKTKKHKYLKACLNWCQHFSPLVYSVDGLAEKEIRAAERRLASLLSRKLHKEYSEMAFLVCFFMNLAIFKANTLWLSSRQERRHINLANFVWLGEGAAINAMVFLREW